MPYLLQVRISELRISSYLTGSEGNRVGVRNSWPSTVCNLVQVVFDPLETITPSTFLRILARKI